MTEPDAERARPTMRDVAKRAGVSFKTVSRVVNAEPGVSRPVREQVQRVIDEVGYRHDRAASDLRRGVRRTGLVGALLQDVGNDYSAAVLRAVTDAAHLRGSAVLAASLDEQSDREHLLVRDLVSRRVDGLVMMTASERQDYLVAEQRGSMPVVFVDRPPMGLIADSVTVDNVAGTRQAVEHLLDHGHRRIAVLSDLDTIPTARLRRETVQERLHEAGVPLDGSLVASGLRTGDDAMATVLRMMGQFDPPTALITMRNSLSVGAIRALRGLGLQHRVALVGFDDFELADLMQPGLTVVRQDVAVIGAEAARLLFARIDGDTSPPLQVVVPHSLVQRGSGEISPSR